MNKNFDIESILEKLSSFENERDWEKFHTVKNLCVAVSVEAGELLEVTQWETDDELITPNDEVKSRLREEVADVIINSLMLCNKLDIDISSAVEDKIKLNTKKYPVSEYRGRYKK